MSSTEPVTRPSKDPPTAEQDSDSAAITHEASIFVESTPVKLLGPPENKENLEGQMNNRQPTGMIIDDRISDDVRDPPGQKSVYIPPGDTREMAYRLCTFKKYPSTTPVDIINLARHGFLYTGFCNRVKCFSCGRTVMAWQRGDNPADKKWHKPDCAHALGQQSDNIPMFPSFLNQPARGALSAQLTGVGTSRQIQNLNGQTTGNSAGLPDRFGASGSSFHVAPGNTLVNNNSGGVITTTSTTSLPEDSPSSNPPRQWRMANVISADHRRFLTNLYLNRELDRLASFARWPTGRPNVSPAALAQAGFFYLGDMYRTQCFSCGGVLRNWSSEDDALEEHRTHSPSCGFVCGTELRNVPVPTQHETTQDLARKYPIKHPSNPHMGSKPNRLATFDGRWPLNRTRAKPAEIAEAGFYFLGERDRAKCWYCNGGLQNWEYDDVPWVEHAKWFPNCQFLLQRKGQLFVYQHLSQNAHLPRPIIGRQDGATIDASTSSGERSMTTDIPPGGARVRSPSPPPIVIDPQEEMRERRERVEKEILTNDNVKNVVAMGFSEEIVRKVLEDRLESGNPADDDNIFDGVASLLDAVTKRENEMRTEREQGEQATGISPRSVPPSVEEPNILLDNPGKIPETRFERKRLRTGANQRTTSSNTEHSDSRESSDECGIVNPKRLRTVENPLPEPILMELSRRGDEGGDLYDKVLYDEEETSSVSSLDTIYSDESHTILCLDEDLSGLDSENEVDMYSEGHGTTPFDTAEETNPKGATLVPLLDIPNDAESIEENVERLCKICFTGEAEMVFVPCGHIVCCSVCTGAIRQCPLCRTKIDKAVRRTNPKEISPNPLLGVTNHGEDKIVEREEERLCKVCLTEEAVMVFMPCGHIVCCRNCAAAVRKCPICRRKIEKTIRTYRT